MDARSKDLHALPDMSGKDVETILKVLVHGARRVERVETSAGAVWIKRYGWERPPAARKLQGGLAALTGQPFLRPSPYLDSARMIAREMRRIETFAAKGFPVPRVLYASDSAIVLSDVAPTVTARLTELKGEDPAAHDALLVECAAELGRLHASGLCHGRPHPRDFFLASGRIGFMDFEEEPEAAMPLAAAQARDLWLLFLQLSTRPLLGEATVDRAFTAWSAAAPAETQAELARLVAFLGKFLRLTRLIGRVHMGSDLRRFLAATLYLSKVLPTPRLTVSSKAGKDD